MSSPAQDNAFPAWVLYAAAGLISVSMISAATARWTGLGAARLEIASPVQTATLRFSDLADGSIGITSAITGREVDRLSPGVSGFVRVVMRGLAFDRNKFGVSSLEPFELSRRTNGMMIIRDPATARVVTLNAFGHDNAAAFERLLEKGKDTP